MRNMKTVTLSASIAAIMALTACGSEGTNSSSSTPAAATPGASTAATTPAPTKKDPVTLTFAISNTVDATPFNKIFKEFEAKTGNKVELQALPGGDFDNMMKTRFSTGDFPDLFLMQPGPKQYVKLRASETLREWSGDKAVWDRIIPTMKDFQADANKKIYGVPFGATGMMGIYYNKDVFAKAGVQPPKNYTDMIESAKKIKAAGVTPFMKGSKMVGHRKCSTSQVGSRM